MPRLRLKPRPNKASRTKRIAAAMTLVAAFALPMPVRAAVCPPFAEVITMMSNLGMQMAVEMFFKELFKQFTDQLDMMARYKISALKVITSQAATSARAIINADQQIAKGEVSAMGLLSAQKEHLRVFQEFSPQTGQGVDPCGQLRTQVALMAAAADAAGTASSMVKEVMAAPGRFGDNKVYIDSLVNQRMSSFATEDEEKLGLGKATTEKVKTADGSMYPLAGADSNAETLFVDSDDPRLLKAKSAYLNYVAGRPDAPVTKFAASNPGGKQYLANKMRKDAIMSIGLNSVAQVSADYSPGHGHEGDSPSTDAGEGTLSKVGAMDAVVAQYYGATGKDRWASSMSQSKRGLMVDQVKMQSAMLAMDMHLLEQARRIEANVGALLAIKATEGAGADAAVASKRASDNTLKPGVR